MKIGIINTGNIGTILAVAWISKGHDIMLSKDTHPEQLQERIKKFGLEYGLGEAYRDRFRYGSLAEAAQFGDVVVFSPYFPRLAQVLKDLQSSGVSLAGKIVIDTMNPSIVDAQFNHSLDTEYMERTSTTEDIQKTFPEAIIFKAFNTMPAPLLDARKWVSRRGPVQIFVGGKSSSAPTVRKLIEDAGFRPAFAGYDLKAARMMEGLSILFHGLLDNEYKGDFNFSFDIIKPKGDD
ncbi:coenzyme F420-dependent NADP oxidoreductase [Xylaria arbuscula]|nr:coenzyme F420-dependent NADP oxidoreductase [Xylaria arbuscula]